MGQMFHHNGRLHIPLVGGLEAMSKTVKQQGSDLVVKEAYCPNGHSLMSKEKIEGEKGIQFIYTDDSGERETEIVISPVVHKCKKTILKGEPFKEGEKVKILCPTCREELKILVNCDCGAPIYLFYLDKELSHRYGHSFCSRIGCVKASQLRYSDEVLRELIEKNAF